MIDKIRELSYIREWYDEEHGIIFGGGLKENRKGEAMLDIHDFLIFPNQNKIIMIDNSYERNFETIEELSILISIFYELIRIKKEEENYKLKIKFKEDIVKFGFQYNNGFPGVNDYYAYGECNISTKINGKEYHNTISRFEITEVKEELCSSTKFQIYDVIGKCGMMIDNFEDVLNFIKDNHPFSITNK